MYLCYDSECILFLRKYVYPEIENLFSQKRNVEYYIIPIYIYLEILFINEYIKTKTYELC